MIHFCYKYLCAGEEAKECHVIECNQTRSLYLESDGSHCQKLLTPVAASLLWLESPPAMPLCSAVIGRSAVVGCAWLCLAVLGCAWLCLAVLGCALSSSAVRGCAWLCSVVLGCAWLCSVVLSCARLRSAAVGCSRLH